MDLDFIKDTNLRGRVEHSIKYIFVLNEDVRNNQSRIFVAETNRVIVLYTISIIEALLHEAYDSIPEHITATEYKDVSLLKKDYIHKKYQSEEVVIAVRTLVEKSTRTISFSDLLDFFETRMLKTATVIRLRKLNDLRNSFHLRKGGVVNCTITHVEEALQLLDLTLTKIPKFIK